MVSAMAESSLDRREVVARLLARRESLLVVTGLGSPTYDVHAAGDHAGNFYLWGAMGSAALIGLGLAQAQPDRRVVVITGDGEQLMGLGGLATIAVSNPDNLVVVVIDNDHFGETGMQTSHTGHGLDLASVAQSCGFAETRTVRDMAGVDQVARALDSRSSGARFYAIKVKSENPPRSLPLRDAVHIKNRFRAHLGLETI
jgi:thiamine pyrophosphate-dependent acetolactate synthase large subunit-like protein